MPVRYALLALALLLAAAPLRAQPAGDCPYPVLFLHGYTGSQQSWFPFTDHPAVEALWGSRADVFHAVLNAYENQERIAGADGLLDTPDDDVLITFANEDNVLAPGCIYAYNFENFWNEDPGNPLLEVNSGDTPGGFFASESDSNEEAAWKQGYTLGRMIERVLAANPGKEKVILVGHSMGGLVAREYLQRRDAAGTPLWWVDPAAPDGHRVARVLTAATPHRGSNFFGNPFRTDSTGAPEDGVPDINSSATRDLRYNYFCFFCSSPGPYLFGGREGNGFGWHTDDINCDGDDNDTITGINIAGQAQGFDDAWDGTTDNPAMPLPTDVRYTWLTSDVGTSGDLVVDLKRQWLYTGSTPVPTDGVAHRLTDTLLTDVYHLDLQEDTDAVARGLDEPNYPAHAYGLTPGITYAGMPSVRAVFTPDGPFTDDPDWYVFETSGGSVRVDLEPGAGRGGRLDLYATAPAPYATGPSAFGVDFAPGTAALSTPAAALAAGTYYVRVRHDGVGYADWRQPYRLTVIESAGLPDVSVALEAVAPPVVIAAGGGTFDYQVTLTNNTAVAQTVDGWIDVTLPDGSPFGPVLGPTAVTLAANATLGPLAFSQNVPGSAPAGTYVYSAAVGTYPGPVLDASSFTFQKAGAAPRAGESWTVAAADAAARAWLDGAPVQAAASEAPEGFGLDAAYPNPFNPQTAIPYRLAAEGPVRLTVYDGLGRRVAVLADGVQAAGAHRAVFDARALPSGVYLIRLDADGETATQRVLLLK